METVHDEKYHYVIMCTLIHSLYFGTTTPFRCGGAVRWVAAVGVFTVMPVMAIVFYKVIVVVAIVYYAIFSIL